MEFSEKFKTFSNAELLNILSNPHRYQEKALNTAKEILDNRSLSEEEMRIAKEELEAVQRKQLQKEERKKEIERKIKGIGQTIADNLNPVQKEALTTEKIIKTVSVTCFILCLFYLYNEFDMIRFMLSDSTAHWDLPTMASFLPLIILLIASILFYKRKKSRLVAIENISKLFTGFRDCLYSFCHKMELAYIYPALHYFSIHRFDLHYKSQKCKSFLFH